MNEMIVSNNADTINSQTLLQMVNAARKLCGEPEVRNNKFIEKILDELDGEHYTKSVVQKMNNTEMTVITMTYKQAMRVAARESKAVRRSLIDQLEELQQKALAAPKQELNISNAAMNAINSITQAALDAIKAIQQATIMQPAIEQHTEPVEDKTLPPGHTYTHHQDDEICFSEMEPYVSNPNLRKELIAIFKFEEREHDPGQKKGEGRYYKSQTLPRV